jgi:hypothetical protein
MQLVQIWYGLLVINGFFTRELIGNLGAIDANMLTLRYDFLRRSHGGQIHNQG